MDRESTIGTKTWLAVGGDAEAIPTMLNRTKPLAVLAVIATAAALLEGSEGAPHSGVVVVQDT